MGSTLAVAELVEDCNLHCAFVEVYVFTYEFFTLVHVVSFSVGFLLLQGRVFGLEGTVDFQKHLQHADIRNFFEFLLVEVLSEAI